MGLGVRKKDSRQVAKPQSSEKEFFLGSLSLLFLLCNLSVFAGDLLIHKVSREVTSRNLANLTKIES